jgi:transposase
MNYEEIKLQEKLFSKLPKVSLVSYLKHLIFYIVNLHKKIKLLEKEITEDKIKLINSKVNCPSSKLPEWSKPTRPPKPKAKKGKKKKRVKNKNSGNKGKEALVPVMVNVVLNTDCPHCNYDLREELPVEFTPRIIEDIIAVQEKSVVIEEIQARVKCPLCKTIVTAQSELALPKSDIGLNTTVLMTYLWVWMAIPLQKITDYLKTFNSLIISTAGVVKSMVRIGAILEPVYYEILSDIKIGVIIYADETGWRVRGELHWLWVFGNKTSSFYWADKSRGGGVIEKILGTCFDGLLISDAWHAYLKIKCAKQTCMPHIFRKIRHFRDAFPEYYSIIKFYEKLKKIISDGEKLQEKKVNMIDVDFSKKLKKLHDRVDTLLEWENPNPILKNILKKVKRQREYILTFVEHPNAESHNNFSEYLIKKGVLKRKVSGGSTSFEGLFTFAVLISIYQTCYLRKISAYDYLMKSLKKYIKTGSPMLLSEYQELYPKSHS